MNGPKMLVYFQPKKKGEKAEGSEVSILVLASKNIKNSIMAIAVIEICDHSDENITSPKLHSQEGQSFSADTVADQLITYKSSESRSMDLTNNGMGNHYLKDVDHGSHCLGGHRTTSLTYMSD